MTNDIWNKTTNMNKLVATKQEVGKNSSNCDLNSNAFLIKFVYRMMRR